MENKIQPKNDSDWGNLILNEEHPLLREIWSARYTHIYEDFPANQMVLIHESGIGKRINMFDWRSTVNRLHTKTGLLHSGKLHTWISEGDGSADKFRNLIKP